jgi:hypothetical protein
VRSVLGETFRLLGAHLDLFTLLALTVWLPCHVLRSYLEFFGEPEQAAAQSLQVLLAVQVVLDPLVVSASISALARIKQGLPVAYPIALAEGLAGWGRLLLVRFVINWAVALPGLGGLLIAGAPGAAGLAGMLMLSALAGLCAVLLVRFAVVDSVVVLERHTVLTAWRRAAELTSGQRWPLLWTLVVLFLPIVSFAILTEHAVRALPALHHFVVRVLLDCIVAVSQSVFTIALFLFYWRARTRMAAPPVAPAPLP